MSTELETEYMELMQSSYHPETGGAAKEQMRVLLTRPDATDAMLVHGMLTGVSESWEHPSTQLLWVVCAGSLDHLRSIARTIPPIRYLTPQGVTAANRGWSCGPGELLIGLHLAYDLKVLPKYLEPIKAWLGELSSRTLSQVTTSRIGQLGSWWKT